MKSAYALLRKGKIFIQSYLKSTSGLWIASGPVYVSDEDHLDDLGANVRDALAHSTIPMRRGLMRLAPTHKLYFDLPYPVQVLR